MLKKYKCIVIFILVFIGLLFADLISKYYFFDLQLFNNSQFIQAVCNDGISFSIQIPYLFVKIVSIVFCIVFIYIIYTKKIPGRIGVMLLAGTVGNLYDRFVFDCVRDFIVFGPFFIFNIADLLLNVGIIGLIISESKEELKKMRKN